MPVRSVVEPFAQQIGARVRDLRLEQEKSLTMLETASGVSKGHVSSIERGHVAMNVLTLRNIARALGMQPTDLLAGLEETLRGNAHVDR